MNNTETHVDWIDWPTVFMTRISIEKGGTVCFCLWFPVGVLRGGARRYFIVHSRGLVSAQRDGFRVRSLTRIFFVRTVTTAISVGG